MTRLILTSLLFTALPALSQPLPTVQSATPDVLRRNADTQITLAGSHIGATTQALIIGPPGVTARLKPAAKPNPKSLAVTLTVAADAPRGLRELRLVTPHGVTRPLLLLIDDLPAVADAEPNDAPAAAQSVTLPAIITGKAQAELDIDCYAFDARKGQRLIFDVNASRAGSKIDASLALSTAAGKRVASDEDTNGLDPLIDYTVPADGRYVLRVQDLQFRGGPDYAYRIRAGELPHVDAVFPLGGQRGKPVDLELTGQNLQKNTVRMDMPAGDPSPARRIELPDAAPVTLALGDHPEARESEPNDTKDQPTDVTSPLTINGRIDKPGDVDVFRFKGPGGPVVIDVDAARLGSRLDTLLTLTDAAGTVVQRNDDAPGEGPDARIQLTTEKDKPYLVWVRDLTDHGGPNYAYRVTLAPPKPAAAADFTVALRADTYRVNRGARTVVFADVKPRGGFKGDVTVTLTNLPAGVTSKPLIVSTAQPSSGVFTIDATPDATLGFAPLSVTATATVAGKTVTRTPAASALTGTIPQAYLSIHDPAPFAIERLGPASEKDPKARNQRIAALEKQLATPTPELEAAQAEWEQTVDLSAAWEVVDVTDAKSASGVKLVREPDGSLRAQGAPPANDTFTVKTNTPAAGVRAIRLEALADNATGPGLAENGNFVLNRFTVTRGDAKPLELASAKATFTQASFDVAESITGARKDGGWAVSPELGKSHHATYLVKSAPPAGADTLAFRLEQTTKYAYHVLGRFRLLVSRSERSADGVALPADVASALGTPSDKRTPAQRTTIAAYYRSISPELAKLRDQLASLKSAGDTSAFPPVVAPNATAKLDVSLSRAPSFKGDITLALEGYSTGVDPKTNLPNTFDRNFDLKPTPLPANKSTITLNLKARGNAEKGTRLAILRAEATLGESKYVVYSEPFPITVK